MAEEGGTGSKVAARTATKPMKAQITEDEEDESGSEWISPWGAAGFGLTVLGMLAVNVIGVRMVTIVLAALGILVTLWVIPATRRHRKFKDTAWLLMGTFTGTTVLLLALFAPGYLNRFWAMDAPVPVADLHKVVVAPRLDPRGEGKPGEDAADAANEVIRQDDVMLRLDSVTFGPVLERPGGDYLLIHVRLGSGGKERKIPFEGFAKDKHTPVLKDDAGKSYGFLEQRTRKLGAGPPHLFLAAAPQPVEIWPGRYADYQLVFEPPPADFPALNLELPASAWGRKGVCKLRITGPFIFTAEFLKKN